ncbi:MAG TPA: potassium/proton antiporter [Dermatophilaceae bacterium]|nr:potassium/proton antiporter [Dermatophilaceae bacterium]
MPGATETSAFTVQDLTPVLLVGALVLVVAVGMVRLSVRSGLPSLLLYLGIGIALGESGLGIRFDSGELTQVLGYSALVLILAEGGLTTSWRSIRHSVAPAVVLSTVGVVVSVFVVALACVYLLKMPWTIALLLGAVLSSTDAAAVFSVLRRVPLPKRITGMLEAESGFNDAPVVILVTALAVQAADPSHAHPWYTLVWHAAVELVGGAALGLAIGWLGGRLMRRVASGSSALFSLGIVGIAVLAYAAAATLQTSGFIACYLAALVLGNMRLPHGAAVHGFAAALGWLAQIGLFVLLGLLASPSRLGGEVGPALVLGLVLLLVARPLSVLVSLTPFRTGIRTQAFLSWAGLRGAVPVVLATVPATVGTPNVGWIFDLVFVLVVIFTLVQAPTLPWVAHRLRVTEDIQSLDLAVEATPLAEMRADLLQVTLGDRSRLHGVEVFELRLPPGTNVTMIVRDGHGFVPGPNTVLRRGDQLLVVTTAENRDAAESRLRAVSREGRLAGWPVHEPKPRRVREPPPRLVWARNVVRSRGGRREVLGGLLRRRVRDLRE